MTRARKQSPLTGFTLLEVMLAIGLLTFIMSAIFGILASARRAWTTTEALITLQQEGRLGLDKITKELRVSSPVTYSDYCGDCDAYRDAYRTVRFSIPIDATGPDGIPDGFIDLIPGTSSVIYGADDPFDSNHNGLLWERGWKIEYQIDAENRQLIRRVLDTEGEQITQRILVKNINPESTWFSRDDRMVYVKLTIEINAMEGLTLSRPLRLPLETEVSLRNAI